MGHRGGPNRTVYCATKHAIEGLVLLMHHLDLPLLLKGAIIIRSVSVFLKRRRRGQ